MGEKNGSGAGTYLLLVLSVVFVAACGAVFWLASTGRLASLLSGHGPSTSSESPASDELAVKAFSDYSWDELSEIAQRISAAPDDQSGLEVARRFGIVGDDGRILDCVHAVQLSDGQVVTCRVVGVRADDLTDGSGKAGLTFMMSSLAQRPMNDAATNVGGWGSSGLRSWLDAEGIALLPSDLAKSIKPVSKLTNNAGVVTDGFDVVSATTDKLWLFSSSEVFGDLSWFAHEFGTKPIPNTVYTDFEPYDRLISSEGSQYAYFSDHGVADLSGYEVLPGALGQTAGNWWMRTPYPVSFVGIDESSFYQVMASGYPSTVLSSDQENGVVAGFCL